MNTYRKQAEVPEDPAAVKRETVFSWETGWKRIGSTVQLFMVLSTMAVISIVFAMTNVFFGVQGVIVLGAVLSTATMLACFSQLRAKGKTEKVTRVRITGEYTAGFMDCREQMLTLIPDIQHYHDKILNIEPTAMIEIEKVG